MSIIELPPPPQAPAAVFEPPSDRLRVITAGGVRSMEARLGASGFDVVAVAGTENALIDAVSAAEPDAIVVDADLCDSLEHVRDLAPDAVLIAVGDHTPAGALGRIEPGVSGTVMAGLLHALVADGVGAAAVWGLVPAFGPGTGLHVPRGVGGWLLSAKADLLRGSLVNTFRDHADLVAAAGTLAVTVSASLVLTMSAPRTDERLARVPATSPATDLAPPRPIVVALPVVAATAATPTRAYGTRWAEGELSNRPRPNRGGSRDQGRQHHQRSDASRPPGVAYGWDSRPPKHADDGHHKGWTSNSVPENLPPGNNAVPVDHPPGNKAVPGDVPPDNDSVPENLPPGNNSVHVGHPPSSVNKGGKAQAAGAPCVPAPSPCTG
jgi:hypothetical protein